MTELLQVPVYVTLETPVHRVELVDTTREAVLLTVAEQGPPGPPGPPGEPGPAGPVGTDAHLSHEQSTASDTWAITHNLGKYPSVTIVDSAGDECEGSVNHVSTSQLVISFSAAFAGRAFLN